MVPSRSKQPEQDDTRTLTSCLWEISTHPSIIIQQPYLGHNPLTLSNFSCKEVTLVFRPFVLIWLYVTPLCFSPIVKKASNMLRKHGVFSQLNKKFASMIHLTSITFACCFLCICNTCLLHNVCCLIIIDDECGGRLPPPMHDMLWLSPTKADEYEVEMPN